MQARFPDQVTSSFVVVGAGVPKAEKRGGVAHGAGAEARSGAPLGAKVIGRAQNGGVRVYGAPVGNQRALAECGDAHKGQVQPPAFVAVPGGALAHPSSPPCSRRRRILRRRRNIGDHPALVAKTGGGNGAAKIVAGRERPGKSKRRKIGAFHGSANYTPQRITNGSAIGADEALIPDNQQFHPPPFRRQMNGILDILRPNGQLLPVIHVQIPSGAFGAIGAREKFAFLVFVVHSPSRPTLARFFGGLQPSRSPS